jgi:hypothetical protein
MIYVRIYVHRLIKEKKACRTVASMAGESLADKQWRPAMATAS